MPAYSVKRSGSLADISKVAGAGLRLGLVLNAVACQVAVSGIDIHSISKGVSLFSTVLKQTSKQLHQDDSLHTTECLEIAQRISGQAKAIFKEIEDMLDQVQRQDQQSTLTIQERFKMCFRKHRVTYLLAHLESIKFSLVVIIQVLQLAQALESRRSPQYPNDDSIAQERAEVQNMLIVRYWSIKKLDRLWDLARQEALDARRDERDKSSDHLSKMPEIPQKLPVIPFGVEASLKGIEESPRDMLSLTAAVLDALLDRLVFLTSSPQNSSRPDSGIQVLPPEISSDSEDDLFSNDAHDVPRGYYLEGSTTDWRKPHLQEARQRAARLRQEYADKQPRVESDSESSESSKYSKRNSDRPPPTLDFPEQGQYASSSLDEDGGIPIPSRRSEPRPYAYSGTSAGSGSDRDGQMKVWEREDIRPSARTSVQDAIDNRLPPLSPHQSRPIPMPSRGDPRSPDRLTSSMPLPPNRPPQTDPDHKHFMHSPTADARPTSYNNNNSQYPYYQQPRQQSSSSHHHHHYLTQTRSQSSATSSQSPSQQPRHHHRHHHNRSSQHSRESSRDRRRERRRTAARNILGVSAIAGFMDALESFVF